MGNDRTHLLRILGTLFGVAAIIGGTIGQGIMRTPGIVAQGVPNAWLIVVLWLAGGLLSLIDAMSSVELAASTRLTGGPYVFARRAFGPFIGLSVGLTDWLGNVAAISYIAVVFAEYLHRLGIAGTWPVGLLAALVPLVAGIIHFFGTRVGSTSQEMGSAIKALVYGALIAALLLLPTGPSVSAPVHSTAFTVMGVIAALRAVISTYTGWNAAIYFSEEMRDPVRTIVRATWSGIAVVTAVYVLMNIALLRVLSPSEMAGSTLVAADAAARVFGAAPRAVDMLVTVVSLVSVATIANSMTMQFPRVLFAIARDANLSALATVAPNGTPRLALFCTCVMAALLASVGVYELLLSFSTSLLTAMGLSVNVAALVLRRREPDLDRPWKMPFFPLPALFALFVNGALLLAFIAEDMRTAAAAFALLMTLTLLVHWITWRRRD